MDRMNQGNIGKIKPAEQGNSRREVKDAGKENAGDSLTPVSGNKIFSSTLLRNQFSSAPFQQLYNLRESSIYGSSSSESFRGFSENAQKFVDDKCKENEDVSNTVSLTDKKMAKRSLSEGYIHHEEVGGFLHFSPGTGASNEKMNKKLELLKRREEIRKAKIREFGPNQSRIDLHATEKKFLNSVDSVTTSVANQTTVKFNAASEVSVQYPSLFTNETYVVESSTLEAQPANICAGPRAVTEVAVDKKQMHMRALTAWLNFLLGEGDIDDNAEMLAKNKKDADQFLKKLLISGEDRIDNSVERKNSYKFFMATRELNEMRNRFHELYQKSSVPESIGFAVKSNKIAIRKDKQIFANIGLQTELLGLLLDFHPFYLQLGLETVLSTKIEPSSCKKSHLKKIAMLITQNLFKDQKIMKNRKFVQGKALINDSGSEALLQHFLTKICQFLYIVGETWQDKVISRKYRCLFVKCSVHKSIGDVVTVLSRELMTGASNLPKVLSTLGLSLNKKQGFLEEFHFHVTNISKDLCDGMILGRAVEILANLPYSTVICCLRNPRGDRIRKVSNLRMAISCAKEKSVLPQDLNVNVEKIVQGSINEIIPLLWQFVDKQLITVDKPKDWICQGICEQIRSLFNLSYEVQNPLELANGRLLSILWKRYYPYGKSLELFDGSTLLEKIANAAEEELGIPSSMLVNCYEERTICLFAKIFISRIYDCYKITHAAITIQRAYRRYRINRKERLYKKHKAAVTIQRFTRGWLARIHCRKIKHEMREREKNVVIVQKFVRGWLARINYQKLLYANEVQRRERAAVILQHEKVFEKRENAACTLQKFVRGWLARRLYQNLLHERNKERKKHQKAAIIIQKYFRTWLKQKSQYSKKMEQENAAAIVLQRWIRGCSARIKYWKLKNELEVERKQEIAAVTLQRYVRGWFVRKRLQVMGEGIEQTGSLQKENTSCDKYLSKSKIDGSECLKRLRELKRAHVRLRKKRWRFVKAVELKIKAALLLKLENEHRRQKAATTIQAWWRGTMLRNHSRAIQQVLTANRRTRHTVTSEEQVQPIMDRVMRAMENLNSERLYNRFKATEVLQKFVGLSEVCAKYVFENGGLECILDSLDGCNRGVGSTEVVIPLCSIMWGVLKFKSIRLRLDEQSRQDIVKQCYHLMLAFHGVPYTVNDLTRIVVMLEAGCKKYKKATYFVSELAKRFAKLPENDERLVALRSLQNCIRGK